MQRYSTKQIVLCAMFTALVAISTVVIQIPIPFGGYVNLGDVFVVFVSFVLGPFGAVSAGLGSAIADIISGYVIYAPATLIIKSVMSIITWMCFCKLTSAIKNKTISALISAFFAELFMVLGYFAYAVILGGISAGVASIFSNAMQGLMAIVLSSVLYVVFIGNKRIDKNK